MPHNIITLSPATRVNDLFVLHSEINATRPDATCLHPLISGTPNDSHTRFQAEFYKHAACDIVVETVFDYPYPYISEKTLRSFACKRMLIVMGPQGVLQLLKAKGFMTFDDIIDEDYDAIRDPLTRYTTVIKEIKKFCSLSLEDIKHYMKQNTNKFNHNFDVLQNLQKKELHQIAKQLDINYD